MTWKEFFSEIKKKDYYQKLQSFIDNEYQKKVIYPPKSDIFKAFELTPVDEIRVVIIGQDPYPNEGQATGLAFSVRDGMLLPPSLKNIYKEIINEYKPDGLMPKSGDLEYLAKQGVLLVNPVLTVEAKKPLSHDIKEYELLFKNILEFIDSIDRPLVFMLWGNKAKKYKKFIKNPKHLIIETNHPSPLSANQGGWFNSNCFTNANKFLKENDINEINWVKEDPTLLF